MLGDSELTNFIFAGAYRGNETEILADGGNNRMIQAFEVLAMLRPIGRILVGSLECLLGPCSCCGSSKKKNGRGEEMETRSRNLFTDQCEEMFGECFNSDTANRALDTANGALFSRGHNINEIRKLFANRT
jgi:hypothetical protein